MNIDKTARRRSFLVVPRLSTEDMSLNNQTRPQLGSPRRPHRYHKVQKLMTSRTSPALIRRASICRERKTLKHQTPKLQKKTPHRLSQSRTRLSAFVNGQNLHRRRFGYLRGRQHPKAISSQCPPHQLSLLTRLPNVQRWRRCLLILWRRRSHLGRGQAQQDR